MDRHGIAARIRSLIGAHDGEELAVTAVRLGVSEVSLRMSLDDLSPHPTIEVIAAIVRLLGVDPNWLLRGEYSSASHHEAATLEETGGREAIARMVMRLLDDQDLGSRPLRFRPASNDAGHREN